MRQWEGVKNWVKPVTALWTGSSGRDRTSSRSVNSRAISTLLKILSPCCWGQRTTCVTHCPLEILSKCLKWKVCLFLHILAYIGCYYFLPPWDKSKLWIMKPRTRHCHPFSWISCDASSGPHFMPTPVSFACTDISAWKTVPLKILPPLCSQVKRHLLKEPFPDGADRIREFTL